MRQLPAAPASTEETHMFSYSELPFHQSSCFASRGRAQRMLREMDAQVIRDVGLLPGVQSSRNPYGDAHLRLTIGF